MQNNQLTSPTRHINGVKAYYKAGVWYADFNHYQQTKMQQGIKASIDAFINWCDRYDLAPQG